MAILNIYRTSVFSNCIYEIMSLITCANVVAVNRSVWWRQLVISVQVAAAFGCTNIRVRFHWGQKRLLVVKETVKNDKDLLF